MTRKYIYPICNRIGYKINFFCYAMRYVYLFFKDGKNPNNKKGWDI